MDKYFDGLNRFKTTGTKPAGEKTDFAAKKHF
jgi:hypothetical protein